MQVVSVFTCAVALLSVGRVHAGQCCFSDRNDCDSEHSFCSKDAKHCTDCGGSYHETNKEALAPAIRSEGTNHTSDVLFLAALPAHAQERAEWCRKQYVSEKDCDAWVSDQLMRMDARRADEQAREAARHADKEERRELRSAEHVTHEALAEQAANHTSDVLFLAALPVNHTAEESAWHADQAARRAARRSDEATRHKLRQTDEHTRRAARKADEESRRQARHTEMAEVAEPLMLAAEVPKVPNKEVSGHCCYSGRNDCDGSRDWCSKDESHCTHCGGTFHANVEAAPAAPSKDAAVAQMAAALPLNLAAVAQGHSAQQSGLEWKVRLRDEFVNETRRMDLERARLHTERDTLASRRQHERAAEKQQLEQEKERLHDEIDREIQHAKLQQAQEDSHRHAPRNQTEAISAKASAFLEAQKESLASDPLSLPALACLSVVGLALLMKAAVMANRRTVDLPTEVLG